MKYTTGLPTPKFADLYHPPARGGRRGLPAEPGAEGLPEGGSDPHAPQCDIGGDRRAAGCVLAHDLAGHQGPDRGDHPGPEGRAAHRRGGARGLRLRDGRHPLPLLELVVRGRRGRGRPWDPARPGSGGGAGSVAGDRPGTTAEGGPAHRGAGGCRAPGGRAPGGPHAPRPPPPGAGRRRAVDFTRVTRVPTRRGVLAAPPSSRGLFSRRIVGWATSSRTASNAASAPGRAIWARKGRGGGDTRGPDPPRWPVPVHRPAPDDSSTRAPVASAESRGLLLRGRRRPGPGRAPASAGPVPARRPPGPPPPSG